MSRNDNILSFAFLGALASIVATSVAESMASVATTSIWTWIEPAAAVVTAFATITLSYFTIVLARETRRLADVGSQPNIVVTIEPNRHSLLYLDMHVENTGTATAFAIEIEFVPRPRLWEDRTDRPLPLRNISVLKPGQSLSSSFAKWSSLEPKAFLIRASWCRRPNASEREDLAYSMDLHQFEGMSRLGEDPAIESARATKKISEEIGRLSSGFNRLSVDTYSAADRDEEEREREARWAADSSGRQDRLQDASDLPNQTPTL